MPLNPGAKTRPGRYGERKQWDFPLLVTHQWTEFHHQQVGCDFCTLGQALQEVGVLECPVQQGREREMGLEGKVQGSKSRAGIRKG